MLLALLLVASPSVKAFVSSNGYGTLQYNIAERHFDRFLQHPYKYEGENVATRDLLVDASFTLNGAALDAPETMHYLNGTGVIALVQHVGALTVTTYGYAPRGLDGTAFVLALQVENAGAAAQVAIGGAVHMRLGDARPEPSGDGQYVKTTANGYEQYGPYQHSAAVACIKALPSGVASIAIEATGADLKPGYAWQLSLAAGESRTVAMIVSLDNGNSAVDAWGRMRDWLAGEGEASRLIAKEPVEAPSLPDAMTAPEAALYRQSLAMMKMAQVQESGRAHGQILASLAASTSAEWNQWNIAWVRDMAYATSALAEAGAHAQARDALAFQLQAQSGFYQDYVGKPYQISVCRYFGDGKEESDSNENGPNVEFDGFGLFLWSLGRYHSVTQDHAFVQRYWTLIQKQVADVLVSLMDPYTQLIKADSSIWEVHWKGKQRQFAYTSITAAAGLCAAGDLADAAGDRASARIYRNAGRQIRQAILEHLVGSDQVIASSLEERNLGHHYYDGAVVEAITMGLIDPQSEVARNTLAAMREKLSSGPGRGLFRNDEGDAYDSQEWVLVNLRTSQAEQSDDLWNWVVQQSVENHNIIAELYDHADASYAGSVPMIGFGAGAYVLAAHARYGMVSAAQPCGGYDTPLEPPPAPTGDQATLSKPVTGAETKASTGCNHLPLFAWWPLLLLCLRPRYASRQ